MKGDNNIDFKIYGPLSNCEYIYYHFEKVVSKNIIKGKMTQEIFKKALINLVQENSILRCYIKEINGEKSFIEKNIMEISSFYSWKAVTSIFTEEGKLTDQIEKLYKDELNKNLDESKGLWRILMIIHTAKENSLNEYSLAIMILTLHHVIIDGNSIFTVIKKILQHLQRIKDNNSYKQDKIIEKTEPIDYFLSKYMPDKPNSDSSDNLVKRFQNGNEVQLIFDNFSFPVKYPSTINTATGSLTKLEFDSIKEQKKQHMPDVAFTSIITAAFLKAIIYADKKIIKNELRKIRTSLHIDLRRIHTPSTLADNDKQNLVIPEKYKNDISCCTCSIHTNFIISKIIDMRNFAKEIKNEINILNIWDSLKLFYFTDGRKFTKNDFKNDVNVSNLGVIDKEEMNQKDFILISTDFTAANQFMNLVLFILSFDDLLTWNIRFSEDRFPVDYVERINHIFKQNLIDFFSFS